MAVAQLLQDNKLGEKCRIKRGPYKDNGVGREVSQIGSSVKRGKQILPEVPQTW